MYTLIMHEYSKYKNSLDPSRLKFSFDLSMSGDTIKFIDISLTDQYHQLRNILDIQVSAKSNYTSIKKTVGQIQTSLWVFNENSTNNSWEWVLDSNDISTLEGVRTGDVGFEIEIKAIVEISEKGITTIPIIGSEQVRFSESDWISYIGHFGYSTKYGLSLPPSLLNDSNWLQSYQHLVDAREHMQRGKTNDALRQCLSVMESFIDSDKRGGPYSDKVWDELLDGVIPQKKEGIVRLFSGVATYLNMVGHHRNRQKVNGNLPPVPIDQYEAELMVGVSQLIVTYMERLNEEE